MDRPSHFIFPNFPMPPSENAMYANNRFGSGKGRIKTEELVNFQYQAHIYGITHRHLIMQAKPAVTGQILRLTADFYFSPTRIWTKKSLPQRIDASNFLKALQDSLCELLAVDDKWVFESTARKFQALPGDEEHADVLIEISPCLKPIAAIIHQSK